MKALCHTPIDIEIPGRSIVPNPFHARVEGLFEGPAGRVLRVPGFYAGGDVWKMRFSATAPGKWGYRILTEDVETDTRAGELRAEPAANTLAHGPLGIDHAHPHHFAFADGTPHFMMPYECDWLWALDLADPSGARVRELLEPVVEAGFNGIIVNVYAHDTTWCPGRSRDDDYGPPAAYPWEGTNEKPDHSRMNPRFFDAFDRMMRALWERGLVAHVFLKVYNKEVNWPERRSPDEDLFFRYVVARYQAFGNLVWDFSKESFYEGDKEYIRERLGFIRGLDAYGHLLTVHDDPLFYARYAGSADFVTLQQHDDFYSSILVERSLRTWPVFNSEFGYEWGPGGADDLTYGRGQSPEEFVHRAWLTVMAGGYPAYYYTYTAWDVIYTDHRPPGYRYWKILHDFMTSLAWWELDPVPSNRVHGKSPALYRGDEELVLYVRAGANVRIDRRFWTDSWTATALNTLTGERREIGPKDLDRGRHDAGVPLLVNPYADAPAAVHVRRG